VEALKVASSGSVFHSSLPSGTLRAGYDVEQALQSAFVDEREAVMDFRYPNGRTARMIAAPIRVSGVEPPARKASCAPPVTRTKIAALRRAPSHDTAPPR